MIRLFSIDVALFLAPFVAYALFLWAAVPALVALSLVAVALTTAGFVFIAQYSGASAHSTYVPAHMENGQLVPGTLK